MKIKNIVRFQLVTWLGTLLNLGTMWLLHGHLKVPRSIAGAVAIELAIIHNFTWHYFITWRDRVKHTQKDFFARLLKYNLATASIDFVVNWSIMMILSTFFGVYYLLAQLIGMLPGPIFKFLANEFVIFKDKTKKMIKEKDKLHG
jgi:dolichol-phosphate mannosyltransferase